MVRDHPQHSMMAEQPNKTVFPVLLKTNTVCNWFFYSIQHDSDILYIH